MVLKPAVDLADRSGVAKRTAFAPELQAILTALRQPRLEHRKVRVDDAGSRCLHGAFWKGFGIGKLAHGRRRQACRTADRHQRIAGEMAKPDVVISSHAPDPAVG